MTANSAHLTLSKGQATGNDFLILLDAQDEAEPSAQLVRELCDRHHGIGADGFLRAVRITADAAQPTEANASTQWYLDYRKADGTAAQPGGNALRVFAAFLEAEGLIEIEPGQSLGIHTSAGIITVYQKAPHIYSVAMGTWELAEPDLATTQGSDTLVQAQGLTDPRPGLSIRLAGPHTVIALASETELASLSLEAPPQLHPTSQTNVEFVVPLGENPAASASGEVVTAGHVRMRVFERDVGETRSFAAGACAAAAAVRYWSGPQSADEWTVEVPGGALHVSFLPDAEVRLTGPAHIVATLQVNLSQLGK